MNLVDLGLEHLGVDVGKAGPDVQSVTRACGESTFFVCSGGYLLILYPVLSTLSACRSPADKCTILVAAHKVVAGQSSCCTTGSILIRSIA